MTHAGDDMKAQETKRRNRGQRTGMESENAFQWSRRRFDDLDCQTLLFVAHFLKGPNCIDLWHGIRMLQGWYRDDTPPSAVPVAPGSYLPIFLLCFAGSIAIALCFYKELGNLERMPGMGVEVEVGLGVKGPVKELEGIGTRDECVRSGLERAKRDGISKVSREMAIDVESPSFESGHGQVGSTAGES